MIGSPESSMFSTSSMSSLRFNRKEASPDGLLIEQVKRVDPSLRLLLHDTKEILLLPALPPPLQSLQKCWHKEILQNEKPIELPFEAGRGEGAKGCRAP